MSPVTLLLVALGGAAGAVARFLVGRWSQTLSLAQFPAGTFLVNVAGSFLIGMVFVMITERGQLHPDWRYVLIVGFLGAFTTFSTFSLETVALLERGQWGMALGYILATVMSCVLGCWLGMMALR